MSARTPKTSQWSRIRSNSHGNLSHLRLLWCQRRLPQREALSESSKVAGAKVHGLHGARLVDSPLSATLCYALLSTFKILCNSSRHSLDSRAILAPTKAPLKPVNLSKIAMISCSKSDFCQTLRGFKGIRHHNDASLCSFHTHHLDPFGTIKVMKLVQLGQNYFPPLANLHADVKSSTQTSKPSAHQFLWMHEGLQAEDALSFWISVLDTVLWIYYD